MRVKRGVVSKRKHKKLLKSVSGYRMSKHRLVKVAKEAQLHAGQYAYVGRKDRKSNFRKLWITRISNAGRKFDLSYSKFIALLKKADIIIDRKMLSYIIVNDQDAFESIINKVKKHRLTSK